MQRVEAGFLTNALTQLLGGKISGDKYFETADLQPPPAVDSYPLKWLMCTAELDDKCGGTVGEVIESMQSCVNSPERRWSADLVETDGRFAAGLYCEYQLSAVQLDALANVVDQCAAAFLQSIGLTPKRVGYLDSAADLLAVVAMDGSEDDVQRILKRESSKFALRSPMPYRIDDAYRSECPGRLAEWTGDTRGKGFDGEYGVTVVVRNRTRFLSIIFG